MTEITTPERILVGLDLTPGHQASDGLSEANRSMINQVLWLAQKSKASVNFVYVRAQRSGIFTSQSLPSVKTMKAITDTLEGLVARGTELDVEVSTTIREGVVWNELLEEISTTGADLFALSAGAHRQRIFRKDRKGKIARRAIKQSPIPVWLIAPSEKVGIKNILVPIKASQLGENCLDRSRNLRDMTDSEVLLLHCVSYPNDLFLKRQRKPLSSIKAYHDDVKKNAFDGIISLLDEEETHQFKIALSELNVQKAIPSCVEKEEIDLVVIGSAGQKGLVGDTAMSVINRMNTSVWVQRPASC
jgi:nucleotide-binding universal stress UspA family protein